MAHDPLPALLVAALAVCAALQLLLPPSERPLAPVGRPLPRAILALVAGGTAPTPVYPAILARPLFSPSRSNEAITAGAPAGVFALLGVAVGGGGAAATLRDQAGGVHTLRPGEAIDGWRLAAVDRRAAVLTRGAAVQSLRVGELPAASAAVADPASVSASRPPDLNDR